MEWTSPWGGGEGKENDETKPKYLHEEEGGMCRKQTSKNKER